MSGAAPQNQGHIPDYNSPINKLVLKCVRKCMDEKILTSEQSNTASTQIFRLVASLFASDAAANTEKIGRCFLKFSRKQLIQDNKKDKIAFSYEPFGDAWDYEIREGCFNIEIEVENIKVDAFLPRDARAALGNDWVIRDKLGISLAHGGQKTDTDEGHELLFSATLCNVCGVKGKLMRCGRCLMTRYCSPECQKKHWPEHKTFCKNNSGPAVSQTSRTDAS